MRQNSLTKTIAICLMMVAQVTIVKAQSYTTEEYDFKTWSQSGSGSYTTAINPSTPTTSVTNTSGQTVYVETAEFYGHDLNGRFANSNELLSADKGIISGYETDKKVHYFSILNLQAGDVVYIEGGSTSNSATMNVTSNNAIVKNTVDGSISVADNNSFVFIENAEYTITSGTTLDLYMNSSKGSMRFTKIVIKKLNTAWSNTDVVYDFATWYAHRGTSTYTHEAAVSQASVSTAGLEVYAETANFYGHDISRFAFNTNNSLSGDTKGLASAQGDKTRKISILDVNANDKIDLTFSKASSSYAATVTVTSETDISFDAVKDGSTCNQTVSVTHDGSFDMSFNTSSSFYLHKVNIRKPQTMTIGATGFATFSSSEAIDISGQDNFVAYYASSEDAGVVTMTKIDDGIIPANTGVMLYGSSGTYYNTITDKTIVGNLLMPITSDASSVPATYTGYVNYLLAKDASTNAIEFKAFTGTKDGLGGKAYLRLSEGGGAARSISFCFESDETTNIMDFRPMKVNENHYYNLNGQHVQNPTKGLYIVNGKKVVIK